MVQSLVDGTEPRQDQVLVVSRSRTVNFPHCDSDLSGVLFLNSDVKASSSFDILSEGFDYNLIFDADVRVVCHEFLRYLPS